MITTKQPFEYLQVLIQNLEDQNGNIQSIVIGLAGIGFSESIMRRELDQARRKIFLITAVIITISLFLVHLLSKQLSRDILTLSDGVKEISKGNLDIDIQVNSHDEIGLLAGEFNKMVRSFRENLQMQKFVSRLTVDMIQSREKGQQDSQVIKKKKIAVLFSDIRGFTSLSEKLAPENLIDVINIYLNIQSKIIEKHNGIIDKFAGDQVMAIFQHNDAADAAVNSAIAIQKKLTNINSIRQKNKEEFLSIGIGINYGQAMIGSLGASSRMDYTAIGDVVNLACKLCNFAREGQIVVTKNVKKKLVGDYSVTKMEPIILSGRRQSEEIYSVEYHS